MIIPITDLSLPEVQLYSHLTEAQLRNRLEPDKGIFIAESPKVIRVALDAGCQPLSLLTEEKHIEGQAADIITRLGDIPVYIGSRALLASLTGYELTRGVLCAMRRPQLPTVEEVCRGGSRVVLVDSVVNSTNTGAIFRAAAALGIDAVLLLTGSLAFVPNVFTTQRGDFVFQLIQLVLRIAALAVGISRGDFRLAILLFCAVSTLVQVCLLGWYLHQVRRYDKTLKTQTR